MAQRLAANIIRELTADVPSFWRPRAQTRKSTALKSQFHALRRMRSLRFDRLSGRKTDCRQTPAQESGIARQLAGPGPIPGRLRADRTVDLPPLFASSG